MCLSELDILNPLDLEGQKNPNNFAELPDCTLGTNEIRGRAVIGVYFISVA